MATIASYTGTVKVLRDAEWITVESSPFTLQGGDYVRCFNGATCKVVPTNNISIHLENDGEAADKLLISPDSSYYYPRR